MHNVDVVRAKNALESYIKGLLQVFINEYGIGVNEIKLDYTINPDTNTRVIKQVTVLDDNQTLSAAFFT